MWAVSHAAGIAAGGLIIYRIRRERLEICKLEQAEEDKENRDGGQPIQPALNPNLNPKIF